jgi:putative Ca2+/H+ antiporter (TMEM165/GDT1 family)
VRLALVISADSERKMPLEAIVGSFFLAASKMGDRTQLLASALAAQFKSAVMVTIGTTLGMLAADGFAVVLGERPAAR